MIKSLITNKIKLFFSEYTRFVFRLILIFLFTRIFEYAYILINLEEDIGFDLFLTRSLNFDILSILLFSFGLLVPALLLALINYRISLVFVRLVGLIFVLINLVFTLYFLINNSLLTCTLFEFSYTELFSIVCNEFTNNRLVLIISFFSLVSLSIFLLLFNFKKLKANSKLKYILLPTYTVAVFIALANYNHTFKSLKYFDNTYKYLLGNSKTIYFIKSYFENVQSYSFTRKELNKSVDQFQSIFPNFTYSNINYPLIHNEPYNNVLGDYFQSSNDSPNIVIIISESLSSSFSGDQNSIGGSLTPFLDSLSLQGLSWSNFISNAERSHGVLPSILGSLPSGNNSRGFINMTNKYKNLKRYPNHNTLIELLQENGYFTNYYYGGWGYFDNVGFYLKEKGIDNFFTEKNFDTLTYVRGENLWGFNDKQLYRQSLDDMKTRNSDKPYLTIYQTISNHSPFNILDEEYTKTSFIEKRIREIGLSRNDVRKIPDNVLGSIFFADDALKELINKYQKRDDFHKTIFIITGDHGLNLNLNEELFEIYRVPLVIYSPLNNQIQNFKGVSSHIDILPSVIALLEGNYNLNFTESKHWIGRGLDTSINFNTNRFIPLNMSSMEMPNFILNNQIIHNNKVFTLKENFEIEEQTNLRSINNVKNIFEAYQYINNYVCIENKIWHQGSLSKKLK